MDKTFACASACAAYASRTSTPFEAYTELKFLRNAACGADARQDCVQKMLSLTALDELDLVTFRCVNEGNSATVR
jgi:hypothetical protein